jgi:hypothetical protein
MCCDEPHPSPERSSTRLGMSGQRRHKEWSCISAQCGGKLHSWRRTEVSDIIPMCFNQKTILLYNLLHSERINAKKCVNQSFSTHVRTEGQFSWYKIVKNNVLNEMVYTAPTLPYSLQDGKSDHQRHMLRNVSTLMDLSTQCSYMNKYICM